MGGPLVSGVQQECRGAACKSYTDYLVVSGQYFDVRRCKAERGVLAECGLVSIAVRELAERSIALNPESVIPESTEGAPNA